MTTLTKNNIGDPKKIGHGSLIAQNKMQWIIGYEKELWITIEIDKKRS